MHPNDGRVVSNFIVQALLNKPITIYGDGSQTRSFCYVDDLIEGIFRLLQSELHEPVNLGNPEEWSVRQMAEAIRDLAGQSAPLAFRALPVDDPKVRQPDITRAQRELGWQPRTSIADGLRRTFDDFRQRVRRA
jgi:nucleoside-diphosphate-sugar epimerase